MPITIHPEALRQQVARIIARAGSAAAEAQQVAHNLVEANLCGHDSHGVGMVPRYVDAVLEGGLKPNASVKLLLDSGALLSLDGQLGYGQVTGVQAMELGLERAAQHGCCVFALARSHHLGRIGHFAEIAVARGMVALHFANVLSRPVVAPHGGGDGRFGTNPCCIGIPLPGRAPFVLDFATSRVAQGKMRVAHNKGERVPEGLLIDSRGRPSTDPGVVVAPGIDGLLGALLPFGEHKGYGLALACELLGGALTGGGTWHTPAGEQRAVHNGMLTILIDPQRLGTREHFEREAGAFIAWLLQSPAAPASAGVQIAGDPERLARAQRADCIQIDDATWAELQAAEGKLG